MSTIKKLSHSACTTYLHCPAAFNYKYNESIRPIKTYSALVFGSGIDAGLNALLLGTGKPLEAYVESVNQTPVGNLLPGKYDYDGELLGSGERSALLQNLRVHGYSGDDIDGLARALSEKSELSENQAKAYDLICRASLFEKASLMFKTYEKHVLPHIEKVIDVQKRSGPGFLDVKAIWRGRGEVIIDNKTAARPYPDNAIDYSAQLAMYASEENISQVVYVVLIKQLKKNRIKTCAKCSNDGTGKRHKTCDALVPPIERGKPDPGVRTRCDGEWTETISPECDVQILHGEITPRAMQVAAEAQEHIARAVSAKAFPCNLSKCNDQFGRPCEYRNLKWFNDMSGLEKVERKK